MWVKVIDKKNYKENTSTISDFQCLFLIYCDVSKSSQKITKLMKSLF